MKERPSFTLWRITISEIMTSFLGTFLFFFIVFLINQVLLFAEDILSRGADLLSVVKLLFLFPTYYTRNHHSFFHFSGHSHDIIATEFR